MNIVVKMFSLFFLFSGLGMNGYAQTLPLKVMDIGYNESFDGFDLIDLKGKKVVIVGEDIHNRRYMPATTLKLLRFLNQRDSIGTLVIEAGASTAGLINRYITNPDTLLLREITRHTFFWSMEHYTFLENLAAWNRLLPPEKKIRVESADIELKQESVILAMNILMEGKSIPDSLSILNGFRTVFQEKASHRSQFNALNVYYYYDKSKCRQMNESLLKDLTLRPGGYRTFFGDDLTLVSTMLQDLETQYKFDYKANVKFKFRDDLIYKKLVGLNERRIDKFLYIVGGKHTNQGASSSRLQTDVSSPFRQQVVFINITGRRTDGRFEGAKVVTELSRLYPSVFCSGCNVMIKNDASTKQLTQIPDYTIAFKNALHVTEFPRTFEGHP